MLLKTLLASLFSLALLAPAANADVTLVFTCKYKEGKGPADLQQWIDEHYLPRAKGFNNSEIVVLSPAIVSNSDRPDIVWLERFESMEAMGKATDQYLTPGGSNADVVAIGFSMWDCTNSVWNANVILDER